MIRSGFCGHCSTEKEEIRELIFDDDTVQCAHCGAVSVWVQEGNTSYYYLVRVA